MQLFLKQQAKERALSASLPHISEKSDTKTFMKSLKGKFHRNSAINADGSKTDSASTNTSSGRNSSSKRYANSFSSFGTRQLPTYAHVQLQKQYKEWEERRLKKKQSIDDNPSSDSATLDFQKTPEELLTSKEATQSKRKSENFAIETNKESGHLHQSFESILNPTCDQESDSGKHRKVDKSEKLNQQRSPASVSSSNLEIPHSKKLRPMTTDFREIKFLQFKTRTGRNSRKFQVFQQSSDDHKNNQNTDDLKSLSPKHIDTNPLSVRR